MIDENQMQSENNDIHNNHDHEDQKMFAMKGESDPLDKLLLKQMTSMQTQLQNMSTNTSTTKYTKLDQINPKIGQPWKRYCWSC